MTTPPHYLREWRKHRGLTQAALAQLIGCDRTLISHVEAFRNHYTQPFLEKAGEALGCAPADLIIRHPDDPEGLWAEYDLLTAEQRGQLVGMAKLLRGAAG